MATHEEQLLGLLEKIGQPEETTAEVPSVLDGTSNDDHVETYGSSEDPNTEAEHEELAAANTDRQGMPEGALSPVTKRNMWVHHDTHPVTYDVALLGTYGTDWFEWEPGTLWREIREDFRVPSINDHAKAKIQAAKTLHINEWYWTKWEVFCWITQALNNNIPDFHVLQKPSIAQLMQSVDAATMVRNDVEFTPELQMFVAAAMVESGVFYAPKPIDFCQDEIETLLDELQIDKSLIGQVQSRWREVKQISPEAWARSPEPVLREDVVDIQVAKLKVACDYLDLRRRQLQEQLRLLK
jgi:hypothetical protein